METLQTLANKSRELLNDQLNSFDSNNGKAGIFISITALFIPIVFSIFEKFANSFYWIILFFIPIILDLIGIYYLIKAMYPKKIFHGINFSEFDNLVNKNIEDVYLFEIGINRDSFNDNSKILAEQNKQLKSGLNYIFLSAIFLTIIFFLNLTINNFTKMADNTQQNSNSNNTTGNTNSSNNGNSGRQIPSTNSGQRSTIEKGGNSGDLLKK